MSDATAPSEIPADLAQVAEEKGISLDIVRRALALGFPPDAVKQNLSMPGVTPEAAEAFIAEQEKIRAGGVINIPPELAETAAAHKFPEALIKRALALGAPPAMLINQMQAGITAEQAEGFIVQQEALRGGAGGEVQLDLSWMKVPTEWGIRVKPGRKGLTVGMINVGTYADVPDYWPYHTEMPRGAYPIPGVPSMGYSIFEKAELWSENSADLYEEAIQRRWRPSSDVPWLSMEDLDPDVEKAVCQLCTHISERSLVAGDIVGRWLPEMSYGYHEVKLYLSTAEFDAARWFEVFRKRALSNGGGLGVQSPGYFHRAMIDARAWTETSAVLHILANSQLKMLFDIGYYTSHNDAERTIFSYCLQDVARQRAYGSQHLRYFLTRKIERREEVHHYLNKYEALLEYEWECDIPLRESLMILLGGGATPELMRDGALKLEYFRQRWANDYIDQLSAAGLGERRKKVHHSIKKYLPQPEEAVAAA
ncbi:MAG TPA: hypothetical protein VMR52_00215 [Dehalococcoidia bacterium]|nr:hypothetical protein [Dehalococcoidia bacterium]